MRGWPVLFVFLLAGCSAAPAEPFSDSEAADSASDARVPAPRQARSDGVVVDEATGARFETTLTSFEYVQPSFSVADQSFMNPAPDLRGSPPEGLNETLIEARITPTPVAGGWSMAVYERTNSRLGQSPPSRCSNGDLGRIDLPDEDGVYRILLPADTWTCNWLAAIFYSTGQPAGAILAADVEVWTTTFEGMAMPTGFSAVT